MSYEAEPPAVVTEERAVELIVGISEKHLPALVPPLGHMVGAPRDDNPRVAWHSLL